MHTITRSSLIGIRPELPVSTAPNGGICKQFCS